MTLTVASDPSFMSNLTALTFASQIGQGPGGYVTDFADHRCRSAAPERHFELCCHRRPPVRPKRRHWLVLSGNTTASTNNSFTVSVVPGALTAGTYTGTITITATNPATGNTAINSPLQIPVTFYVSSSPLLVVTLPGTPPSQPVFTAQVNGASPATQAVTLLSTNPAVTLTYTSNT